MITKGNNNEIKRKSHHQMNQKNHSADNIPELRFPEFVNEGEWEEKTLNSVSEVLMGSSPKSSYYNDNKIGLPLLQGNADIKNRLSAPRIYTSEITKECQIDDILLSVRAPVGTVAKSKHKACIGRGIAAIRAKNQNSQEYLYQWLFAYESSWQNISQGGTFDAVNSDDIRDLMLPIPKPPEQHRIASCLSSLDELLAANSQKLDALKEHKKGLMQNLFPQMSELGEEGLKDERIKKSSDSKILKSSNPKNHNSDNVPKVRFPEFVKDGEWRKSTLDNLGKFLGGGTPDRSNGDFWVGKIPWISSSDIGEDDIHNISITRFINDQAVKQSATKIIPKGSVLFVSRVGVGKLAISREELCTSQDFTNFVPTSVLNYFIGYYFSANKHLLQSLNQGTSIKGFSKTDLENFELFYPKNPKEQQKIASCLSSLDDLITVQAEKIEQLKLHKKGLMQGLFPRMERG
jgi:type I restriction enzyme, S subunit